MASPTPIWNNNDACVKWCHNMTSKGNRHIELRENSTREWIGDGSITVSHVNGKLNPSDIFTKEMRDGANFRCLRDAFMSRASTFLRHIFLLSHPHRPSVEQPSAPAAQSAHYIPPPSPGILNVLLTHSTFRTPSLLRCLSHAGRFILSRVSILGRTL